MIRAHISISTDTQLASNIDIALVVDHSATLPDPLNAILIALPQAPTVNALHLTRLRLSPLLKALTMNVLTTGCYAPDDVFAELEFHDTDWAVTFDGFTRTAGVGWGGCRVAGLGGRWCVRKYLRQLGA